MLAADGPPRSYPIISEQVCNGREGAHTAVIQTRRARTRSDRVQEVSQLVVLSWCTGGLEASVDRGCFFSTQCLYRYGEDQSQSTVPLTPFTHHHSALHSHTTHLHR